MVLQRGYRSALKRACASILTLALVTGLVASFATPSYASGGQTGSMQGTVVDAKTLAPISGATVAAVSPSGSLRATTNASGFFTILGLIVDTYTVSIEAKGYEPYSLSGVTITGDQSLNVGNVGIAKTLQTIARVTSRAQSSVFQPNQTVDSYTISGERILQTVGKASATNENDLALAVPGVTLSNSGGITIRGGLRTEVGYQYDGVDFTEPFFSQNASNARYNGISSLQVVEGAGDATQGNVGGGVVNLIPKRGTYPSFGSVDFEAGGPNYFHQFAIEYGWASPNGRFSDYIAYNGQRGVPYGNGLQSGLGQGYTSWNSAQYNAFWGNSYEKNDDFVNNFVYKFGKNNSQSLQVLAVFRDLVDYGNLGGGFTGPNPIQYYPNDVNGNPLGGFLGFPAYTKLVGLNPGTPQNGQYNVNGPEEVAWNPTRYLKFEYDNNLGSSTFIQLRYYNWETLQGGANNTGTTDVAAGLGLGAYPTWNQTGGPRVGGTLDITQQIGSKSILTLATKYEDAHPIWDGYDPNAEVYLLLVTGQINDFLPGGYLSSYFPGGVPRIPNSGINYNGAWYQTFGIGLREQWNPSDRFKADIGLRVDGQNQNFGLNPFNTNDPSNPSDVAPVGIGRKYLNPRELEPRIALDYQAGSNDAFRAGYGRSVIFLNAQTSGTPGFMYNYQPFLSVPATDTTANPACGSGKNPAGLWKCANYAEQLYWLYDQNFDAPDLGLALPAVYNNYDFTYQHQFKGGYAMHITPFHRLGTNLPSFALLTGLSAGAAVFTVNNEGINRSTGVEFGFTTPDRPTGFSGFLSMTYQNVIGSTPPLIGGEDALPINGSGSLGLNDTYRAGYVSPFSLRVGGDYKTKSGFRFNPVLEYDRGYPYSIGNTLASSCAPFVNEVQVNFGCGVTPIPGFQAQSGTSNSTNYADPSNPGNPGNPNIAWTRGTPATSSSGGVLWKPNLSAKMTVEYTHSRDTVGVAMNNVFGNSYNGAIPIINPYYQPVSTGLSGPLTGINPYTGAFPNRGFANVPHDAYAFSNGAYLLVPQQPMSFIFYYQRKL